MMDQPSIRDLGVIGDRRTAALVSRHGQVVWYCPGQFDAEPLLTHLIDPGRGGAWTLEDVTTLLRRAYLDDTGVLETVVGTPTGEVTLVDFMPYGAGMPRGLCRLVRGAGGARLTLTLPPGTTPGAPGETLLRLPHGRWLAASHPLHVQGNGVQLQIPAGESGWAFLGDGPPALPRPEVWLEGTLDAWRVVAGESRYDGPYRQAVQDSLRALRLLTFEETGSVVAALTTSLPEVLGGARNYDYRYVWFRDAGMIVRALSRLTKTGTLGRGFLNFICQYAADRDLSQALPPLATVGLQDAPPVRELDMAGYRGSRPVRVGNDAHDQLQLDVYGNIMLASAQLYTPEELKEHWPVLEAITEYYCAHWNEQENGIWEEQARRPYVSSRVLGALGLEALAGAQPDAVRAARWRDVAADIRRWITGHALNREGAFAAVAGEEAVDVVAALYPVWGYCAPDAPEMLRTIEVLDRDYRQGHLYRRALRETDSGEGAFLAGTLWVALYWTARDPARAQEILDAVLAHANDLGLLAEEVDLDSGELLGNFPQTFVHSALIGAVVELAGATRD